MALVNDMNIVEAVEILSSIADLNIEENVGILRKTEGEGSHSHVTFKTFQWLNEKEKEEGLAQIKDTFASILRFLQEFYRHEYRNIQDEKTADRIKTIMVLVNEAAKKIDLYSLQVGQKGIRSVTEIKEYRTLQSFFHHNISRSINEGTIGKWLLEITKKAWTNGPQPKESNISDRSQETSHVFIDLETVKNDTEYELFALRKEDGSRFFSQRIIRNIKLISDFGNIFNKTKKGDLLSDLSIWNDRYLQQTAKTLVNESHDAMQAFFKDAYSHKENPFILALSHALLALMMASNPQNLMNSANKKRCGEYFSDFLTFFRKALSQPEYLSLVENPPAKEQKIIDVSFKLVDSLSLTLFDHKGAGETMQPLVRQLLDEGGQEISPEHQLKKPEIWSHLAQGWQALSKVLKTHPNGPLNKVIQSIVEGHYNAFEPISVENIPYRLFTINTASKEFACLRIPSPTHQEGVTKAEVIPEFKAFLRKDDAHLLIVMQDRTSWKEYARAIALEEIKDGCHVITLPTDTDFYHQLAHFYDVSSWEVFSNQLLDQAGDLTAGYYFDETLSDPIESYIPKMIESIHTLFFKNSLELSREERIAFIDIFYLFITLKAINQLEPKSFSFTCKDSLDNGNLFSIFCWIFFELLSDKEISPDKILQLEAYLFGPPLISRERGPLKQPFQRFIHAVRQLERVKEDLGVERYQTIVKDTLRLLFDPEIADGIIKS